MMLAVNHQKRSSLRIVGLALVAATLLLVFVWLRNPDDNVKAADKNGWIAGNIIDDSLFTDANSMSKADIQNFLNQKIGNCDIWGTSTSEYGGGTRAQYAASRGWHSPPYTCLNKYYEVPKTEPGGDMPANNYSNPDSAPEGAKSAAWIIKDAANRYGISPKVLLVKIATESSGPLTSDQWPLYSQYKYAMGSHCPDSGPNGSANCDPKYAGFSIQMYSAAELLRYYLDSMQEPWWSYKKPFQNNHVLWNVIQTGCGGQDIYVENKATAALYTYTPYQPNSAALNNIYGTGDGCSAYGNRNFWRTYIDWFGDSRTGYKVPEGAISELYYKDNNMQFLGAPISNEIYGLPQGFSYVLFQKGIVYWSDKTGALMVAGGLYQKYNTMGREQSKLGFPIDVGERYYNGGAKQTFQEGTLYYWFNNGQTFVISNANMAAKYESKSSVLQTASSDTVCGIRYGGCYQMFKNGEIKVYWSEATGAHTIAGGIKTTWEKNGSEWGKLGLPTSDELYNAEGAYQTFQGAEIYWPFNGSQPRIVSR